MKYRLPLTLAAIGGLLLGTQTAHAIVFEDFDDIHVILDGAGDSYTSTFNIAIDGFNPVLHTITSATASFELYSNDNDKEEVDINLGAFDFLDTPGNQINGSVTFSSLLSMSMVADLQSDGIITYRLTLENSSNESHEDVQINWAKLVVNASPRSVPDGGATIGLLGFGLLGLAALKRKLHAKR
jgi:hypothetical protein